MPLLMCPNDNAAMQTVKRADVEFDMCPTCRGVWLDRGELEKLMSAAVSEASSPPQGQPYAPQQQQQQPPQGQPWGFDQGGYGKHGGRGGHGGYGGHGKRRGIFDIFD